MKHKPRHLLGMIMAEYGRFSRRRIAVSQKRAIKRSLHAASASQLRIAIRVTGGLGDHIVAARFLRDLQAEVGSFEFDLYSPLGGEFISQLMGCKNYYLDRDIWASASQLYPLAVHLHHLFVPQFASLDWLRLASRYPKLAQICARVERQLAPIDDWVRLHPRFDGHLARKAVSEGARRHNYIHKTCEIEYGGDRLDLQADQNALTKFGLYGQRIVTISNGFDVPTNGGTGRATKVYPHTDTVARLIKEQFSWLKIVQLGANGSTPLQHAHLNLLNKTSIREAIALITHSELHIDNEGGLVHIAASAGTKSCVFFGPTNRDYFAYETNINLGPAVCGNCYWEKKDWMNSCMQGFEEPPCLAELSPNWAFDAVSDYLKRREALNSGPSNEPAAFGTVEYV